MTNIPQRPALMEKYDCLLVKETNTSLVKQSMIVTITMMMTD